MPRRRDTPCARCGTLMWSGKGSLPADQRVCQPCRRQEPAPYGKRPTVSAAGIVLPARRCDHCGGSFSPVALRPDQRFCSTACSAKSVLAAMAVQLLECAECGASYHGRPPSRGSNSYCGAICRARGGYKSRKARGFPTCGDYRHRAAKYGVAYELVIPHEVFARDGWVCQLCKQPVDPALSHPDPRCASLDHVVPMSKGGPHTYENTQLTHLRCNLIKHAKYVVSLPEVAKGSRVAQSLPDMRPVATDTLTGGVEWWTRFVAAMSDSE